MSEITRHDYEKLFKPKSEYNTGTRHCIYEMSQKMVIRKLDYGKHGHKKK